MFRLIRSACTLLTIVILAACGGPTAPAPATTQIATAVAASPTHLPSASATEVPTPNLAPSATLPPPATLVERLGKGIFKSFAWSPDGSAVAVLSNMGVYLFAADSLAQQSFIPVDGIGRIFYRADGQLLAGSWQSRTKEGQTPVLTIWSVTSDGLQPLQQITGSSWSSKYDDYAYQVSPDGALLAINNNPNKQLELWKISDGTQIATWDIQRDDQNTIPGAHDPSFVFAQDSKHLVFCTGYSYGGKVNVLSVASGKLIPIFTLWLAAEVDQYNNYNYWPGNGDYGLGLSLSPDNTLLATGGPDSKVRVWDVGSGKLVATLDEQKNRPSHVSFSPDGRVIVVVNNGGLYLYKTQGWKFIGGQLKAASQSPLIPGGGEVIFSPDGSHAAAAYHGTIYFTDLPSGARSSQLTGFSGPYWGATFSPDGSTLAVVSSDIHLFNLQTRREIRTLQTSGGAVKKMAFSPDGIYLAATMANMYEGCDDWAQIWRVDSGSVVQKLELASVPNQVACAGGLAYSPDGRWLAIQTTIEYDSFPQLWQVKKDGTAEYVEDAYVSGTDWLAYAPDGADLVVYTEHGGDSEMGVGIAGLNLGSQEIDFTQTGTLKPDSLIVVEAGKAGWNPSLGWVAVGEDKQGRVIAARAGLVNVISTIQVPPKASSNPYVISPNLDLAAIQSTVDGKSVVGLWSLKDDRWLGTLPGGFPAFSPDGKLLIIMEDAGGIAFWQLEG
jgi:WD40 repeat protein